MLGQKNLADRLNNCGEKIRSQISIMEAYAENARAVDVQGLMSLAVNLSTANIDIYANLNMKSIIFSSVVNLTIS